MRHRIRMLSEGAGGTEGGTEGEGCTPAMMTSARWWWSSRCGHRPPPRTPRDIRMLVGGAGEGWTGYPGGTDDQHRRGRLGGADDLGSMMVGAAPARSATRRSARLGRIGEGKNVGADANSIKESARGARPDANAALVMYSKAQTVTMRGIRKKKNFWDFAGDLV